MIGLKRGALVAGPTGVIAGGAVVVLLIIGANDSKQSASDQPPPAAAVSAKQTQAPASPTPGTKEPEKVEHYPIAIGKTIEFGNVDINLTSELMQVGALIDVNTGETRTEGLKLQDVILNPDVPDAKQKLNTAILFGQFLAWQSEDPGRSATTFEQFLDKVNTNEDVSFSLYGFTSGDIIAPKGEFKVDPRKTAHIVLTSTPSPNIQPFGGDKFGYRTVNGELYVELYDYQAFGVKEKVKADSYIDVMLGWALATMPDKESQKKESISILSNYDTLLAGEERFHQFLITSKTDTYWTGTLNVR